MYRLTPQRAARPSGYTLVELVVVMVVLGILSAYAVPRFFERTPFAERGYADELSATLRYAQKTAIASGCDVGVTPSATGYLTSILAAPNPQCVVTQITRSDGTPLSGTCPSDVTCPAAPQIVFTPSGGVTSVVATLAIGSHTLDVDQFSGLVTVK
jgi:MSHA pilin protein MshC